MIALRDSASISEALETWLPEPLNQLIKQRVATFREYVEGDLSELVHFVIVEPGDIIPTLAAELGFSPLVNPVDGSRFGAPTFTPSFEWVRDHGSFFELVYILSDEGFGKILFVPDDPGVEFDLHMMCLEAGRRS